MGWAMSEAAPASVPLPTDLRPEEMPAQPSLGLRVEKRVEKISEASARSASISGSVVELLLVVGGSLSLGVSWVLLGWLLLMVFVLYGLLIVYYL